jgi:hypothetical protein
MHQDLIAQEKLSLTCLGPYVLDHIGNFLPVPSRAHFSEVNREISAALKEGNKCYFEKLDNTIKIVERLKNAETRLKKLYTSAITHYKDQLTTYYKEGIASMIREIETIIKGSSQNILVNEYNKLLFCIQNENETRKLVSLITVTPRGEKAVNMLKDITEEAECLIDNSPITLEELKVGYLKNISLVDIKNRIIKKLERNECGLEGIKYNQLRYREELLFRKS